MPKTAACRERCFNGVRDVLDAMKVDRILLCERGNLTADVANLVPICTLSAKETLGVWLEDMAGMSTANTESENDGSVVLLDSSSFCAGNSTVRNSSRAALSKSLLEPRGSVDRRRQYFNPETS